ncbi:hypothetical protein AS144_05575 [Francisella endosymbiont of Amblyomma maculatum]|nr:hypothetical protein AS144_05575 [Francisella endosymbiont of Amblyomma maculatum]
MKFLGIEDLLKMMKVLANISKLNVHNLVYKLASEIKTSESNQSLAEVAGQINDYFAITNCKDFKLLNTQLLNTKVLYNSGVLLELDYK